MTVNQVLWQNNAGTTLAGPIDGSQTTIAVTSGGGAQFPNPGPGQFFSLTIISAVNPSAREIVDFSALLLAAGPVDLDDVVRKGPGRRVVVEPPIDRPEAAVDVPPDADPVEQRVRRRVADVSKQTTRRRRRRRVSNTPL